MSTVDQVPVHPGPFIYDPVVYDPPKTTLLESRIVGVIQGVKFCFRDGRLLPKIRATSVPLIGITVLSIEFSGNVKRICVSLPADKTPLTVVVMKWGHGQ
jgi:hypothetical protein